MPLLTPQDEQVLTGHLSAIDTPVTLLLFTQTIGGSESGPVTKQVLDEHAALMQKFPNMEHDEPYMAHVPPGKTGEIVWTFNRAGEFDFACLIAGHYQAGMVGKIVVKK